MLSARFTTAVFILLLVSALVAAQKVFCPTTDTRTDQEIADTISSIKAKTFSSDALAALDAAIATSSKSYAGYQVNQIMKQVSFSDVKHAMVSKLNPYIILMTKEEMIEMLQIMTFSSDRLKVLAAVADALYNATIESKRYIVEKSFSFSSDRDAAMKIFESVVSRNCVFGTVKVPTAHFLVDVSGSMDEQFKTPEGVTYSRLSYVKEQLSKTIVEQLKPYQRFNIIGFSTTAATFQPLAVNATKEYIDKSLTFVKSLRANGGTDVWYPISVSFNDPNVVGIYLLSDGLPNSGSVTDPTAIVNATKQLNEDRIKAGKKPVMVNTISFLLGKATPQEKIDSQKFMSSMAFATNGTYRAFEYQ